MPHHLRYFYLGFEYASDINCAGVLNIRECGFSLTFTFPIKRQNLWFCVESCKYGSAKTRKPTKNENCTKIYMIQNLICGIPFFFFFLKILLRTCRVFIFVQTFQLASPQFFLNFRFSSRASKPTKAGKKDHTFYNTVSLNNFTNFNSLEIENDTLSQHSQKPFWLYKFSSRHVYVSCQKKYLHCTLSWRPIIAFLKHFESKCLYISIYLLMKMFLLET